MALRTSIGLGETVARQRPYRTLFFCAQGFPQVAHKLVGLGSTEAVITACRAEPILIDDLTKDREINRK